MRCFIRYKDTARDLRILINYQHATDTTNGRCIFNAVSTNRWFAANLYILGTQITILQCTIAGGRTIGPYEKSFIFVHQHGSYDVTSHSKFTFAQK